MQTKIGSFIEACINTAIGYGVTVICSPFVYGICGVEVTPSQMTGVAALFTILSVLRSYLIRRFFNFKEKYHGKRRERIPK